MPLPLSSRSKPRIPPSGLEVAAGSGGVIRNGLALRASRSIVVSPVNESSGYKSLATSSVPSARRVEISLKTA
jgi:hypothetical protein